jgi:ribosomal protein L11 methyltransferase
MSSRAVWKLSVVTPPEAEEAVAEVLAAQFGAPASIYTDLAKGETTVDLYLGSRPAWSKAARERLGQTLARNTGLQPKPGRGRMRLNRLGSQDWSESWKRHFKTLEIGTRLLIRPSWSRRRTRAGQVEVVLDPGLSFGTGEHPTTHFCLSELARHRVEGQVQSFLDIGTGSGILAICASKLGYEPVHALDRDREAIRIARANACQNKVGTVIQFRQQDLARLPQQSRKSYSIICANLISDLLLAHQDRILARLQERGVVVLAGILSPEFPSIQAAYEAAGLRLVGSHTAQGWRSGSFRR